MEELCEMMEKCGCDVVLTVSCNVLLIRSSLTTVYCLHCTLSVVHFHALVIVEVEYWSGSDETATLHVIVHVFH